MENENIPVPPTSTRTSLDLGSIDVVKAANEGVEVQLYHPGTNADLGVVIKVLGRDSTEFRRLSAEQNRRRMAKMTKGGTFKMGVINPEELENDLINLLAACTISWTGVRVDGAELPCSRENAAMLYTRFPWIREQVDATVGDRSVFLKG